MTGPAREHAAAPRFDPHETPVSRRRVLIAFAAGTLAGGGVATILAGCQAAAPVTVRLDLDPSTLRPDTPTEVPFTLAAAGRTVTASAWLVRTADGSVTAFDPRCTHLRCRYAWETDTQAFRCACHPGLFRRDGTVISGPPPRPLDRFPLRIAGGTVEIDVPASFVAPLESLPG